MYLRNITTHSIIVLITLIAANFWAGREKLAGEHYRLPEALSGFWISHPEDDDGWGTGVQLDIQSEGLILILIENEDEIALESGKYQVDKINSYFSASGFPASLFPNLFGTRNWKLSLSRRESSNTVAAGGGASEQSLVFDTQLSAYTNTVYFTIWKKDPVYFADFSRR